MDATISILMFSYNLETIIRHKALTNLAQVPYVDEWEISRCTEQVAVAQQAESCRIASCSRPASGASVAAEGPQDDSRLHVPDAHIQTLQALRASETVVSSFLHAMPRGQEAGGLGTRLG